MALHIEDEEIEALIQEAAAAMGVPPLEAIRILLERRREAYRKEDELAEWRRTSPWRDVADKYRRERIARGEEVFGYEPHAD